MINQEIRIEAADFTDELSDEALDRTEGDIACYPCPGLLVPGEKVSSA